MYVCMYVYIYIYIYIYMYIRTYIPSRPDAGLCAPWPQTPLAGRRGTAEGEPSMKSLKHHF